MTRISQLPGERPLPTGSDPIDEYQRAAARSLRLFGPAIVVPLRLVLYALEVRAGTVDLALHLDIAVALGGSALLIGMGGAPPRRVGLVGTTWFAAFLVAAQAHYGFTAGVAAGWMALAFIAHVFLRWRGSLPAVALQLAVTLGSAAGLVLGWWSPAAFSSYGVAEPAVLLRMALVVACAMAAISLGHEHLIQGLLRWQRRFTEARERQREAERAHARAAAEVEHLQRLESVGRLATGVAHDVNDALTIIMGNAEIMAWASPDEADDLRTELLAAAAEASRTTSQLMGIARGTLRAEEEALGPLVSSLADLMRKLLPSDIALVVRDTSTRVVRVDSVRFQQVLLHLIANARDAIPRAGSVEVSVEDSPDASGVRVSVVDSGRGWSPDAIGRAFDPVPDAGSGLPGMGLGPARDLAARYGGTVEITSAIGAGTRVELHLGVDRSARRPGGAGQAPALERAAAALELLRGRAVLVAEDEEAIRRLMVAFLGEGHAVITVVPNALEARAAILRQPFHLFITDAVMPGGGTVDAIEEYRRRNRRGRVLVVSGHVREDVVARGIESGAVSFLPKPFSRAQLLAAVAGALEGLPAPGPLVR